MALKLNGSTGYLEMAAKVIGAYPFSMSIWVSKDGGSGQFWMMQGQSNADRYISAWLDGNGTSAYATTRNPAAGDNATLSTSPNPNATMRLVVVTFLNASSRKFHYAGSTATSTVARTDDIASHDRVVIGALHHNGTAASLFCNGSVAEPHFYNVELSSGQIAALLADTTKPEATTGWFDGWTLKDFEASGNYVSIGGSRTLVASGSVVASGQPHPIARTSPPAAAIAWTETADTIAVAASAFVPGVSISSTWTENADTIAITGTATAATGALTIVDIKNNTGYLRASETFDAYVYAIADGELVVSFPAQVATAGGDLVLVDELIVAGTDYRVVLVDEDDYAGAGTVTAT